MNTTRMLKDLLERVESGEVVVTNFDVSNEMRELEPENGWMRHESTGEQTLYITTKPGVKKPAFKAEELPGVSVNRFDRYAAIPASDVVNIQTEDKDNG